MQFSLAGIEEPPDLTDSLFFALRPDESATSEIELRRQDLCSKHGLRGKPITIDRLHITLHFLGVFPGVPRNVATLASEAAASIRVAPFEVRLDCVKSFPGKAGRPLVLGSVNRLPDLMDFQKILDHALTKVGLRNRMRTFTPHLTLLYDKHHVKESSVDPVRWTAREFVLVRSLYSQSRHETLARWPLQPK